MLQKTSKKIVNNLQQFFLVGWYFPYSVMILLIEFFAIVCRLDCSYYWTFKCSYYSEIFYLMSIIWMQKQFYHSSLLVSKCFFLLDSVFINKFEFMLQSFFIHSQLVVFFNCWCGIFELDKVTFWDTEFGSSKLTNIDI